jgi:NADPH-dependent 2,4-dienoyl-CoA reductase/sulfur reductase-like enzyme/rhodanese-related sulfurtransferase
MDTTRGTKRNRIVVIGGVAAGPKAAARARRRDPQAEITIVERGSLLSYAGCGLPFYVEGLIHDVDDLMSTTAGTVRDSAFFADVKDIRILTRTEAQRIDRAGNVVHVRDLVSGAAAQLPYDKLVLATGATPVVPPVEGMDLQNVFRLHHPADAVAMREAVETGAIRQAVLIGGGLIGLETAAALTARGVHVTVVEMMDQLLAALLDLEMAAYLHRGLRQRLAIRLGERVLRLEGDTTGRVARVYTTNGAVEAQLVLVATGVRPNVQLARDAGIAIGKTGGIAVNARLQTSDPDIYAGGDCVENVHLVSGQPCFVPLGSTANKHGRVIGDNVTGGNASFPGVAGTTVFQVLDFNVARTGLTERQARELGYDVLTALVPGHDRAHYYPTAARLVLKLVTDRETGRLLGAQVVGPGEAVKRIDVLAAALTHHATVDDLPEYDLGYAPPVSTAVDVLAQAANVIRNKRDGLVDSIAPAALQAKLEQGDDLLMLDVRSHEEFAELGIDDPRVVCIPIDEVRRHLDDLPRGKEIVIFCAIGVRGYEAFRALKGAGFRDVKLLDGGLVAWPYETRGPLVTPIPAAACQPPDKRTGTRALAAA